MPTIASIHDKFLRAILSNRDIAIDYFKVCLPQNVAEMLDLSTLTQLPDTYISKELRKTASDIVYACRAKRSKQELRISLLLEHKSTPEKFTPVQILSYIASGHLKQIAQDNNISPIIPVLLYHGKEGWPYRTLASLFKDISEDLGPFIPDYDYIYHDLGEITDEQINALENKFLQASFLALKYSQLKEHLIKWIPTILSLAMGSGENLNHNIIVYIFGVSGLKEEEINEILEDVPANIKHTVMNTLDIFVEKGKKIGLEEGLDKGRQEKTETVIRNLLQSSGLSEEQIASAAEVTVAYVAQIREELDKV
jgi:predicted transposase/invertase (TIGR01784 family)